MSDTDTKAVLRKLLQDHVGEHNSITQSQLAEATGVNPSTLRSELRRIRAERNIPIANKRNGYYVIASEEEKREFIGHINKEIESKRQTIEDTLAACAEFDRDEVLDDTDDGDGCEKCGGTINGDPYEWFSAELCSDCYDDAPATRTAFETFMEGSA